MVQKFVKQQAEVMTKDGECRVLINIQLDINVNENGVSIKTTAKEAEEESVDWAIPDFTSGQKLKFGKEEK